MYTPKLKPNNTKAALCYLLIFTLLWTFTTARIVKNMICSLNINYGVRYLS